MCVKRLDIKMEAEEDTMKKSRADAYAEIAAAVANGERPYQIRDRLGLSDRMVRNVIKAIREKGRPPRVIDDASRARLAARNRLIVERWQAGESPYRLAESLGLARSTIRAIISDHYAGKPRPARVALPRDRDTSRNDEIMRRYAARPRGQGKRATTRAIAAAMGLTPATVWGVIDRRCGRARKARREDAEGGRAEASAVMKVWHARERAGSVPDSMRPSLHMHGDIHGDGCQWLDGTGAEGDPYARCGDVVAGGDYCARHARQMRRP
jgi:DNA-binding CsgD family transcriptional regulator